LKSVMEILNCEVSFLVRLGSLDLGNERFGDRVLEECVDLIHQLRIIPVYLFIFSSVQNLLSNLRSEEQKM